MRRKSAGVQTPLYSGALLLLAAFISSPGALSITSGSAAWTESTSEGKNAYKNNDLAQAKAKFELSVKDAEAEKFNWEALAESWGGLGVVCLERGELEEAEKAFKNALELDEKIPENQIAIGQCYERLGILNFKRQQFEESEKNLRKALNFWNSTLAPTNSSLAEINEFLAEACIKLDKLDDAEVAAKKALEIRQNSAKESKSEYERSVAQCLRIALKKDDLINASALLKKLDRTDSTKKSISIQILTGDLYFAKNEPQKAMPYYAKALLAAKKDGMKTAQILNCARRIERIAKTLGLPQPKALADFNPEELTPEPKNPIELTEAIHPGIDVPFGKDEFDGNWQFTDASALGSDSNRLKWNVETQEFDYLDSRVKAKVKVTSFDGQNIAIMYTSNPEFVYEGTYDGNSFKTHGHAGASSGISITGTRVSSAKRERRDGARAVAIAQAKKLADEKEQSTKLAQEVNRALREREESKAKEAQTSVANRVTTHGATLAPVNRPVKDKWALVVGISKFNNPKYNLRFAAKDAKDFANFLVRDAGFREDHVRILLNENATRKNIMSSFGSKWLPNVTEADDLAVVYISTHGTPSHKDRGAKNYIVAFDTEADDPYATGVDMEEIYRRLTSDVKSDRVLIVMDTCYSGGSIPGAKSLEENDNFDLSKLSLGAGQIVLSSSGVGERSWESKGYANGVFTKNLIDVLRENGTKLNAGNTFEQLKKRVQWEVKRDFSREQTPQLGGNWEGRDLVLSVQSMSPREAGSAALEGLATRTVEPTQGTGKATSSKEPRSTK
ncbi:MAG: caspase family protein [Candidatus Obscuribacterales bacterium]|nr:caspase family protein [Candidatus Obscuribacterales bacterium]